MSAAEAMFFDAAPVEHEERARRDRKAAEVREVVRLMSRSPLRSRRDQSDAGHLPLFVAGNERVLL